MSSSAPKSRIIIGVFRPGGNFFYGIAIYMYWNEGVHARPHFHARYSGQAASVAFDGEINAGVAPAARR